MLETIGFKSGTFVEYTATRSFSLGKLDVRIQKGSELSFDGQQVNYGGESYNFPSLRSAVTAGWIVPSSEYDEADPAYSSPISANIQVRPATGNGKEGKSVATLTEADERIVMSSASHAKNTRFQNRAASAGGNSGIGDSQEGVPVRSLKTPSRQRSELTADSAGAVLRAAENVQITPGQGITVDEMLARMSPEQRESYLTKKSALARALVPEEAGQGREVGRIKKTAAKTQEGGFTSQLTTASGSSSTADLGGSGGAAQVAVVEEDGIKFTVTNGAKKGGRKKFGSPVPATQVDLPVSVQPFDVRVKIALSLCADFPGEYDFSAPLEDKLSLLRPSYGKRADVIMAAFAAESDEIKGALMREFPQVFA